MNYADFGVTCAEELEQDEWSLTRPTSDTPKGGTLTVAGLLSRNKYGSKIYLVVCSRCASDPELFGGGVFKTLRTDFTGPKKKTPCGCAKRVFWKPEQYDTLVKRSAEGVRVLNFGTFSTKKSIVRKSCPIHGETSGDLESFLRSGRCPRCVDKASHTRFSSIEKEVVTRSFLEVCDSQFLELKSLSLGDCYQNSSAVVNCTICDKTHIINNRFSQFVRGETPFLCSCRKDAFISELQKFTEEDMIKRVKDKLSATGATLIELNYDSVQPATSTTFRFGCFGCGEGVKVKYTSLRTVSGQCKSCSAKQSKTVVRLSEDLMLGRILEICKTKNFKFLSFTNNTDRADQRRFSLLPSCCGNAFETSLGSLEASKRDLKFCPVCSRKEVGRKKSLCVSAIKRDLKRDGYDFVGFPDGYANNKSMVTLRCMTHGNYTAKIADVRGANRSKCPLCAGKIMRYGYINILQENGVPVALKFGVTSNVEKRLRQQMAKTVFEMKHLSSWHFEDRDSCISAELECRKTLVRGVLSFSEMKDGHTETVSVLDLEKIIAIYEKHGGKRIK